MVCFLVEHLQSRAMEQQCMSFIHIRTHARTPHARTHTHTHTHARAHTHRDMIALSDKLWSAKTRLRAVLEGLRASYFQEAILTLSIY